MHYTEKMSRKIAELENKLARIHEHTNDLYSYLALPKFHEDTTVQVQDVYNRIEFIRRESAN